MSQSLTTKNGHVLQIQECMSDFGYELKIRFTDNTVSYLKLTKSELLWLEREVHELALMARAI